MRDFSLSRAQVDWGIPVPWDTSQTVYVWTEALHGYLTGAAFCCCCAAAVCLTAQTAWPAGLFPGAAGIGSHPCCAAGTVQGSQAEHSLQGLLEAGWPADIHIVGTLPVAPSLAARLPCCSSHVCMGMPSACPALAHPWRAPLQQWLHVAVLFGGVPCVRREQTLGPGKDILRFHAVMWPALLLAAGLPAPRRVVAHGFLTKDGLKMGKSLGNTLDPVALVDAYGADAVRWFFATAIVFGEVRDGGGQRRACSVMPRPGVAGTA